MAKFNAAEAVEALEYDFTKYVPGCEGVIPEPSTDQMEQFFDDLRTLAKQVQSLKAQADSINEEDMTSEQVDEVIAAMDDISLKKMQDEMVEIVARITSNTPSAEEIKQLPYRVLQAFIQWITGEFRPEAGAATTRR